MKLLYLVKLIVLSAVLLAPMVSWAQDDTDDGQILVAGVAGGAIAGAEVVIAVEAIFRVDKPWAYIVFPLVGAGGGGVGGYFLTKKQPKAGLGMFVGSLALLIPSAILASAATSYDPEDEDGIVEDNTGSDFSFEGGVDEGVTEETTTTTVEAPEGAPTTVPPPVTPTTEEPAQPEEPTTVPDTTDDDASIKLRRLQAGSLFYIDADGNKGFSVPNISVWSSQVGDDDVVSKSKTALEVHIPLLRIDLP